MLDWLLPLHVPAIKVTSSQDLFEESSEYLRRAADAAVYKPADHRELQCSGLMILMRCARLWRRLVGCYSHWLVARAILCITLCCCLKHRGNGAVGAPGRNRRCGCNLPSRRSFGTHTQVGVFKSRIALASTISSFCLDGFVDVCCSLLV